MKMNNCFKSWLVLAGSLLALSGQAAAVEVAGVSIDDSARVAGAELKLNGAGVRTKVLFKVYVAALYLGDKKSTPAEVLAAPGPKRVSLTMLREVSSDTLSQALLEGLNHNSSDEEKSRLFNQMLAIGQIFGAYRSIKPRDVITVDWVPNTGTVIQMNGKKLGDTLPDVAFYNAILKIWLGDRPADKTLKRQLLGEAAS
ncbi:chalcone isomerase family protein [Chitinimonas koreensis]|uniref:chalcone isomerase family protein n=1 Tax=Chitinimonas koreensis TaxID=356302 RepID=UPI0003F75B5D|nr:chalcone isomerase family protein [Chitinimonas koreensis]